MYPSYLNLIKPGIVTGNLVSLTGGFLLASRGNVDWNKGMWVAVSVAFLVASACVLNNVVDRDIDAIMVRTRNRPMVRGRISIAAALSFAGVLGLGGLVLLYAVTTEPFLVALMLFGYVVYTGFYTLVFKWKSIYGTLVDTISGAIPPVVGYCTVCGKFDAAALTLLFIFIIWQLPHSYAITIFRAADYEAAAIPVLPVVKGWNATKNYIVIYIFAFAAATLTLAMLGYVGRSYILFMSIANLYWLRQGFLGLSQCNDVLWARKLFISSIAIVLILNISMSWQTIRLL